MNKKSMARLVCLGSNVQTFRALFSFFNTENYLFEAGNEKEKHQLISKWLQNGWSPSTETVKQIQGKLLLVGIIRVFEKLRVQEIGIPLCFQARPQTRGFMSSTLFFNSAVGSLRFPSNCDLVKVQESMPDKFLNAPPPWCSPSSPRPLVPIMPGLEPAIISCIQSRHPTKLTSKHQTEWQSATSSSFIFGSEEKRREEKEEKLLLLQG